MKAPTSPALSLDLARAFQPLFQPKRYKIYHGGRGGAKSWSFARALTAKAHTDKLRIGCFRELQNSIKDSVHRLLCDQIQLMGLGIWFDITQTSIRSLVTGSEFLFKGLRHNAMEIKSTEGIDIAWVEEAQLVSKESWATLIPTIRKPNSEIWMSFNAIEETDPTYQFVLKPPPDSIVRKVGWEDNPWFPEVLDKERLHMLATDPEAYEHIWGGSCRIIGDAVIFKGRYVVEPFETPDDARFFHGVDWGYSQDPIVIIRCYVTGRFPNEHLWIDQEQFGHGVELDETAQLFDNVATARKWPIKADNARPECISFMARQGFMIAAAEKWKGSVEDGISHLKAFKQIHIHPRCKEMTQEARLYSWKIDRVTQDVLPIIVDKHNHGWDAVRYALDGYIRRRGAASMWARLAS